NVGNVHHDSLTIHFADNILAEIGETVVHGLVGGRIRPFIVIEMRQRHVTHAQIAEHPQDANIVANHVAAFDTDERGNFSLGVGAAHFFGSAAEREIFRILDDVFVDGINLVQSFLYCGRAHDASINPDGKENRVHAAFAHAGNIHVAVGIALAEIEVLGEKTL